MVRIALVQQRATGDRAANRRRGLEAVEAAASNGAGVVCFAELAFDMFYPAERATGDALALAEPVSGPTVEAFAERARALGGAEIVFVPQAGAVGEWPEGLYEAEMRVAAFQNGYYTALCNRVGPEPRLTFAGESFVCDPAGEVIARAGGGTEEILYCDVDPAKVAASHARRLFLRDRRPELYGDWLK